MRDGGSCDGVQIQGWLVGFAAIFGRPATSLETKLYPHAPYGDRKGEGALTPREEYSDCGQCKDNIVPAMERNTMDMGLSGAVGICVYSVAKLD